MTFIVDVTNRVHAQSPVEEANTVQTQFVFNPVADSMLDSGHFQEVYPDYLARLVPGVLEASPATVNYGLADFPLELSGVNKIISPADELAERQTKTLAKIAKRNRRNIIRTPLIMEILRKAWLPLGGHDG